MEGSSLAQPEVAVVIRAPVTDADQDDEHAQWLGISQHALRAAYGDDEPEYSLDMIKEANPEFDA